MKRYCRLSLFVLWWCTAVQAQTWQPLGPTTIPQNSGGIGRVSCIRFNPVKPGTFFVGTPAGGLWKTTDNGTTWQSSSDTLYPMGISDIAINPSDTNNIVLGLGDGNAKTSLVLDAAAFVTTDNGATWNKSGRIQRGSVGVYHSNFTVNRIIQNPASPATIALATSVGYVYSAAGIPAIYPSTLINSDVKDLEFKPGAYATQYAAVGGAIYRSVNGGTSFTQVTQGLPSTGIGRISLAVTSANPAYVYALCATNNGNFGGVYRSTDDGVSWTMMSNTPNVLAPASDGSGSGGKGMMNLSIAASPTDANTIFVGGVNIWRSTDGGTSWTIVSHYKGMGAPFVAEDVYDLQFIPPPASARLYACTNGGVFYTVDNGATWSNISNGVPIAQALASATFAQKDSLLLVGTLYGTLRWENNVWSKVSDSVGYVSFNPNGNGQAFLATLNGRLLRSNDTGKSFTSDISPPNTQLGYAPIPYSFNPKNNRTAFALLRDMWKTTDGGASWTKFFNTLGSIITSLSVSPTDTNVVYILTQNNKVWRSQNGGSEWRDVTANVNGSVSRIIAHPNNADKALIIKSSISPSVSQIGIYVTDNGGLSWTTLSFIGSDSINGIYDAYWKSDNCGEQVLLATSKGVYAYNTSSANSIWVRYGKELPNTVVNSLHLRGRQLRAATMGRGIWNISVPDIGVIPDFTQDKGEVCPGDNIQFTDKSLYGGASWVWEFEGGTPPTSSQPNPIIQYLQPGTYNVKLIAYNGCGNDSVIRSAVTVLPRLRPSISSPKTTVCIGDSIKFTDVTPSTNGTRLWSVSGGTISTRGTNYIVVRFSEAGSYSVSLTASNPCGTNTTTKNDITVSDFPPKPTINKTGNTLTTPDEGTTYQWYFGKAPVEGATTKTLKAAVPGKYSVRITNKAGCSTFSDEIDVVLTSVVEQSEDGVSIYPNPASDVLALRIDIPHQSIVLRLRTLMGEEVYSGILTAGQQGMLYSIPLQQYARGIYLLSIDVNGRLITRAIVLE